jgi:hypothetical protein
VPWLRQLVTSISTWRLGFVPPSVQVGFAVDKVALGHIFLIGFPLYIIPPWLSILIFLGMNKRPMSGHSSATQSHHIDKNMNNRNT